MTKTGKQRTSKTFGKGDLLDDRFMLVEILGSEGISTAYKAIDRKKSHANKKCYVTIKVLKRRYLSSLEHVVALTQAVRTCKNLDHPNIATIHGFHRDGDMFYLHMEYLPGESLGQKIRRGLKRMPVKQAVHIVNEIGRVLAYAHERGVVYDDLKPANVILTDSGEVKVLDFGIAQALRRTAKDDADAPHFGPDNYSAATPSYASPELLDLREPDPRDDVYALACIAYELLAGRHPFGRVRATGARDHGLELRPSDAFSRAQWSSLQKALAFDRDERTPTVAEFLTAFNASTKWVRRVSLAAGLVVISVAVGLFIDRQIPVREWSVEPKMMKTPTLSGHSDANQHVSSRLPEQNSDAIVELTTKTYLPVNDRKISGQVKLPSEKKQTTEGVTRFAEQAPLSDASSSPAQHDTASTTAIEPQPNIQAVQSNTDTSVNDADKPTLVQPPFTMPAEVKRDSLVDVEAEPVIQTVVFGTDTTGFDIDESTPVQLLVTGASTAAQQKKPVSENDEFATITEALPKVTTKKTLKELEEARRTARAAQSQALAASQAEQEVKRQAVEDAMKIAKVGTPDPIRPSTVDYVGPPVVINEFMASNRLTIADAHGGYDDWIELYNRSQEAIELSGFYLSDNPKKLKQWRFPNGSRINANSYLVIWADRASSYTDMSAQPPELHTNFELSGRGEHILLVDTDENGNAIIDHIAFSRQRDDRSMGRSPNGFGEFIPTLAPTPGRANSTDKVYHTSDDGV